MVHNLALPFHYFLKMHLGSKLIGLKVSVYHVKKIQVTSNQSLERVVATSF